MYNFQGIATSTQPVLPRSMHDPNDAVMIAHWICDALRKVFGNTEDRPSFTHSEELEPDENPRGEAFAELFVINNILIEYSPPLAENQPRFVIRRDLVSPPVWEGNSLPEALIQLLTEDAKVSINDTWRVFSER